MEVGDHVSEGIARRCWEKYEEEQCAFALYTPFFISVASDTLDYDAFCKCISQDVHLLKVFLQAYETVEHCADHEGEKSAVRRLRESISEKLPVSHNVARKWGFDLEEVKISDATAKYRDLLLRTASGILEEEGDSCMAATQFEKTKVAAYTVAAIAPVLRLYVHLCETTLTRNDINDSIYKKWLQYYTSLEIKDLAQTTEDLLDKLSVSLTGEELQVSEKLYHQALKLQVEFFASQRILMVTEVPLADTLDYRTQLPMFCDFDFTCSKVDSFNVLAQVAIESCSNMLEASAKMKEFQVISKEFLERVESVIPDVPAKEFDYEGLSQALEQIAMFEKNANAKVEELSLLKGLSLNDIRNAGRNLALQKGCREFFQKYAKNENPENIQLHVISSSCCGDIIRSAFFPDLEAENVHSNELVYEEFVSTGEIVKMVESPMEKLQVFKNIVIKAYQLTQLGQLRVYIGQAMEELLCLAEANIGIVFSWNLRSEVIMKLGKHYGISFVPLIHGVVERQRRGDVWKPRTGVIYTVDSWAEIQSFIFGL